MLLFKVDNNHIQLVESSLNTYKKQVYDFFKKKSKDGEFNVLVQRGLWDGKDPFMTEDGRIPIGLWKEIYEFSKKSGVEVRIEGIDERLNLDLDRDEYTIFVNKLYTGITNDSGDPFYPRDYQFEGVYRALKHVFCCEELATSAGKTSIFYTYNSYLKYKGIVNKDNKTLLIVPNITLVNQTALAFEEFDNGLLKWNIHKVGGPKDSFDLDKFKECDMLIITYQSLINLVPECLEERLRSLEKKRVKKDEQEKHQKDIISLKKKIKIAKINNIASYFGTINVDECLHPDTLITMSDWSSKKIKDVKPGDIVLTINDTTFKKEYREVDYVHFNLSKDNQMFEIELENGSIIKVTGNHKVKLINGSYKRVDELDTSYEILSIFD